jgi:hypothetical protein
VEQRAFLLRVVDAMEQAGIDYAITGSWASTTYGLPRTTHDLDIVASPTVAQAGALARALPPPIYADPLWLQEAAGLHEFFNVIDPTLGIKVDFWPLKSDAYSQAQFRRRRREEIAGRQVWVLAPEDVILSKLLWYQQSDSERQLRDCAGVWQVQRGRLDEAYLDDWAARLGLTALLDRVKRG